MSEAVHTFLPRFWALVWPTNLYCTLNFIKATAAAENCDLSNYQRTVDMIMVLSDKRVVFISNREEEQLLCASNVNFNFAMANWSTIFEYCRASPASASLVPMTRGPSVALLGEILLTDTKMLAAISFFAGEGNIPVAARIADLSELVRDVPDLNILFEWCNLRNRHTRFSQSDAEDAFLRRIKRPIP